VLAGYLTKVARDLVMVLFDFAVAPYDLLEGRITVPLRDLRPEWRG
jgi:hypothetical protein